MADLLLVLASRGVTLDQEGRLVRMPDFTGVSTVSDAHLSYFNARLSCLSVELRQRYNWVANLALVAEELDMLDLAAPWSHFAVFWTRLHGLIAELREHWRSPLLSAGVELDNHVPNPGSPLAARLSLLSAVDAVVASLTSDELIYADYRRQTESHPTQDSYAIRWSRKKGGSIVDERTIRTLGKTFTVGELDDAVRRILVQYSAADGTPNESAIAVAFARRVRTPVDHVLGIMRRDFIPE